MVAPDRTAKWWSFMERVKRLHFGWLDPLCAWLACSARAPLLVPTRDGTHRPVAIYRRLG